MYEKVSAELGCSGLIVRAFLHIAVRKGHPKPPWSVQSTPRPQMGLDWDHSSLRLRGGQGVSLNLTPLA